eukprot:CAMPEP_0183574574 /NCGR_PEP_ID=MMETSP0371-20130417/133653_1 /TAXON_ID=268820 /ORGANISM="Peridinium aciculiferum, Strain PAER-2" /LENGTH=45 /DNA_ID= /DNA_START= /DNA_END= /DNA_ORIENTATION=
MSSYVRTGRPSANRRSGKSSANVQQGATAKGFPNAPASATTPPVA